MIAEDTSYLPRYKIFENTKEERIREYVKHKFFHKSFNYYGAFYRGIKNIQARDSLFIYYIEEKDAMGAFKYRNKQYNYLNTRNGILSPTIAASGLLNWKEKPTDYFKKRLIIVETLY